jgi:hypothetical protein
VTDTRRFNTWNEDVEDQLTALVEKRHIVLADTDEQYDPTYQDSVQRFNEAAQAELAQRWYTYHRNICELHTRLADKHAAKAERFFANVRREEQGGGEVRAIPWIPFIYADRGKRCRRAIKGYQGLSRAIEGLWPRHGR